MTFQEHLASLFPDKRKEPWLRLLELGFPTKEHELFQYVRLKELYGSLFARPLGEDKEFQKKPFTLMFYNGKYVESSSCVPKNLVALPLAEAYATYGSYLIPRNKAQVKEEMDPFALLNHALYEEGVFLYVPPKTVVDAPIHIFHVVDCPKAILSPRIHVFAGKESSLDLCFEQSIAEESTFTNGFVDLALEERTSIRCIMVSHEERSSWHFESMRATLKKESRLHTYSATNGGHVTRQDYSVRLMGEGAECSLNGVWKLRDSQNHHVNVLMKHEQPFCTSLQTFKGVLNEFSKSSFEGKIFVCKEAQKTKAYQMNHNLVLGERAMAYSKPNLQIYADDVKASHGATVGKLNGEDLFYLKARGIEEKEAKNLLVHGFLQDVLEKIPLSGWKEKAQFLIG